jgi:glycosyltransferase involved in cell wall biosynthesis
MTVAAQRVLVLHNRYRQTSGEEQAVELHVRALERAGIQNTLLERDSAIAGRVAAGVAMLQGGAPSADVARRARELGATVTHCHNLQPLLGLRALAAARAAGSRVVLQLHNYRLFCAIAVSFRDGEPCYRCRGGLTAPGLVLNCRGNLPESAVYAFALARQLEPLLEIVDLFLAPSHAAAGQLAKLGIPAARLEVLPHYLPEELFAASSRAGEGGYALTLGRLAPEKGLDVAIDAAARAGFPLKIAGAGPLEDELRRRAQAAGAPVELLGHVDASERDRLLRGAAMLLMPSLWNETFGYGALEAMAAGVPVVAARAGGLPELVGDEACVPRGDARALAERMRALVADPVARQAAGEAALARARTFGEDRYRKRLLELYERA